MNQEHINQLRLFLDILCARAAVFAEMGGLKLTLEDPSARVWSMEHVALTSAETWAVRYASVEPDMPDSAEDPHYLAELQTLDAMSHFAPLPFTSAWRQRLRNPSDIHLRSEGFNQAVSEFFLRLEHVGFRLSRLMHAGRFRYSSAELLEDESVVLFFCDSHETMLVHTTLSEVVHDMSDEQLHALTPCGALPEHGAGLLHDLPLYSLYGQQAEH